MRLIAAEDYADWKGVKMQEVYLLIESGKLQSVKQSHGGLRRLNLIYMDHVPGHIPSLNSDVEYLSKEKIAKRLGVGVAKIRKQLQNDQIQSINIKGYCFIPMNQFDNKSIDEVGV
ncbi:hypothetical protein [Piscirickettsia salmonis]|uniref:hypothetical protein n=1 Tax=Piscirickettsia salmonis TaxID=1238 RepID=UPI0012BAADBF|nr:hypothetical protein [Piscirickettsia salmonis]QGP41355.1 hypothetical protein Psal182_03565 [Piscirickettsia salmonis]QGP57123.1 hypothetical protein PsalSR1_04612 [Piscirickettsia salmonis]